MEHGIPSYVYGLFFVIIVLSIFAYVQYDTSYSSSYDNYILNKSMEQCKTINSCYIVYDIMRQIYNDNYYLVDCVCGENRYYKYIIKDVKEYETYKEYDKRRIKNVR